MPEVGYKIQPASPFLIYVPVFEDAHIHINTPIVFTYFSSNSFHEGALSTKTDTIRYLFFGFGARRRKRTTSLPAGFERRSDVLPAGKTASQGREIFLATARKISLTRSRRSRIKAQRPEGALCSPITGLSYPRMIAAISARAACR